MSIHSTPITKCKSPITGLLHLCGEGGIRTPGTLKRVQQISSLPHSTTLPPLLKPKASGEPPNVLVGGSLFTLAFKFVGESSTNALEDSAPQCFSGGLL
jgi:hypothetical protein